MNAKTTMRRKAGVYMNYEAGRWAAGVPGLGAVGQAILRALAESSDQYGCSWSSQGVTAAHAQCAKRTVGRYIRIFQERGLVRIIGRIGYHGGRISCVCIVTGWPKRKLMPETGHPKLGRVIREDPLSRALHDTLAQESRRGEDTAATQNKIRELKNTTTDAQMKVVLDRCFQALGPWANDGNRASLSADLSGLLWLVESYDLERHILPVLQEKSGYGLGAPHLRTWRYFREPIQRRAGMIADPVRRQAPEDEDTSNPDGREPHRPVAHRSRSNW